MSTVSHQRSPTISLFKQIPSQLSLSISNYSSPNGHYIRHKLSIMSKGYSKEFWFHSLTFLFHHQEVDQALHPNAVMITKMTPLVISNNFVALPDTTRIRESSSFRLIVYAACSGGRSTKSKPFIATILNFIMISANKLGSISNLSALSQQRTC